MQKPVLFRAKPKDWKTNSNHDFWIEGFYLERKETSYCFKEDYEKYPVATLHFIAEECMTDWGMPNDFQMHEIDPDTLCQFTGWYDNARNKIFENDIVEFVTNANIRYRYLVCWCNEMNAPNAIPMKGIAFNGVDYWNGEYPQFRYETLCLMLQDPYGDFADVNVIGNIVDEPYWVPTVGYEENDMEKE